MTPSQFTVITLTLFAICCAAPGLLPSGPDRLVPSRSAAAEHGPQIFNAISDALRKYGTTVHPNGMSFFIATVPEGVLFHHGSYRNSTPTTSLEYLAYEIEHAEIFARGRAKHAKFLKGASILEGDVAQSVLGAASLNPPSEENDDFGWLHTYRTVRPMHFLFLDGLSANKDDTGVIDSQDYILRASPFPLDDRKMLDYWKDETRPRRPPGPWGEYERARDLCKLCDELQLQGVIRTETPGSEIIKCKFAEGLEQVQSIRRIYSEDDRGPHIPDHEGPWRHPGEPPSGDLPYDFESCFRDVGSTRTLLDYSSMVSAFFFHLNFTNPNEDERSLPRLVYTTSEERIAIKDYLMENFSRHKASQELVINWKDIADLIVRRYASRLMLMANSSSVSTVPDLKESIESLLNVFVDYAITDTDARIASARHRCAAFYLQTAPQITESDKFVYVAFKAITTKICETLFDVEETLDEGQLSEEQLLKFAQHSFQQLIAFLGWTVFEEFRLNVN